MDGQMIDLLTIGDCDIDIFMRVSSDTQTMSENANPGEVCFIHGSKIPVDSLRTSIAGNSCNVAVGCSKFGLSTAIYSELGNDESAKRIISQLSKLNVNIKYCVKNTGATTNIHTIIIYKEERTIFSYHEKRNYKLRNWETPKWIYYSSFPAGFENFQAELVEYLNKNSQIGLAFNPGTFQLRAGVSKLKNILEKTHILFVNKDEAKLLTGFANKHSNIQLHKALQSLGVKMSVITYGKFGASSFDGRNFEEIGARKVLKVVDKTGAGDAFSSGFLSAIFHGKSMKTALLWGSKNSAEVIQKIGSLQGLLTYEDI